MWERRKDVRASPPLFFFSFKTFQIMGKGRRVHGRVTVKRKPKLSSNKGGFLVAKVAAVNKNKQKING